jgi:hypothetical protein
MTTRGFTRQILQGTWVAYAAAAWSLNYGVLGLTWSLGGNGFPFGRDQDPAAELTWFADATPEGGGPLIAIFGVAGATIALAMARSETSQGRIARTALLVFAWGAAAVLLLIVPDYRVLVAVAYAPVFLVGLPFGWPPANYFDAVSWPVVHQLICIAGGFLWVATAVVYGRTGDNYAMGCKPTAEDGWTSPAAAARWGRWAVAVAVIVPCLYAVTRWAWALGIPLGISEEFLREGQAEGAWWAGAALGAVAVGGALLTLGLIQPWGEVFPRWVPFLSGRSVPAALAIVPASLVAVIVTEAGLMFVRLALTGYWEGEGENWAALAPELLWPVWGVSLGMATFAYYFRRRGQSRRITTMQSGSVAA